MLPQHSTIRLLTLTLLTGTALSLTACQTAPPPGPADAVTATQAASVPVTESLDSLEKQYKKKPDDVGVAVRYARALRENDRLSRASIIVAPFAKNDRKPSAMAKTEYASIQAALGNYDEASQYAARAIKLDGKSYQAHHIQGIALDAKGDHAGAEDAFRKALELWEGDPTPVLNNLGLNLASQGFLDEATDTLRKALATSPNRSEIERNLRIVEALRESGGRAPSYLQKERDKKNAEKSATEKKAAETKAKAVEEKVEAEAPAPVSKKPEKTPVPSLNSKLN